MPELLYRGSEQEPRLGPVNLDLNQAAVLSGRLGVLIPHEHKLTSFDASMKLPLPGRSPKGLADSTLGSHSEIQPAGRHMTTINEYFEHQELAELRDGRHVVLDDELRTCK